MFAHFETCEENLPVAVNELFAADPQVQAVGIARNGEGYGFKAVKNEAKILPAAAIKMLKKPPRQIKKIPVEIETVTQDIVAHPAVPHPLAASFVPES